MAQFTFDFKINTDFNDVSAAKHELERMTRLINQASKEENKVNINVDDLRKAQQYAEALDKAIKATEKNGKSVSQNLAKELRTAGLEAGNTEVRIRQAREEGNKPSGESFRSISRAAKIATQDIRATDTQLDRLKRNIQEGFGQTIAFGIMGAVSSAIAGAVAQVVQLDKTMTQLSIVSGQTRAEMEQFRDAAFDSADALGATAKQFMEAALIYKQQGGLAAQYAEDLGKATVLGANIDDTGNDAQQISEYMTAVMNGFDMLKEKGADTGNYIMDVLSKLGAVSGSSLGEMAEGLQRTANIARLSGYEFEQISAAIATVSETTRRSAATIGNGFKSILVSFQQLREAGDEEVEAFSNKIEETFRMTGMEGVSIFDNGNLRDAKDIMDDIGDRWKDMNKEQKAMISEAIAGKYQAEVFQAFMENQDRYKELIGEAYDSAGIAAQQQLIYMDSMESKINQLKNAWQDASSSVANTDWFKGAIESITVFLKSIGEIENSFLAIGAVAAPVLGLFAQIFGGKFMAEFSQNKSIKNMREDIEKMVSETDKLSGAQKELIKEQTKMGENQQSILENLGGSAATAYRKAQDELRELKVELQELEKYDKENATDIAESIIKKGGYKDFDRAEFTSTIAAAREEAKALYQEQNNGIEETKGAYKNMFSELASHYSSFSKQVKKGEVTAEDIEANYRKHLQLMKEEMSEIIQLSSTDEEAKERIRKAQEAITEAVEDETLKRGALKDIIEEHKRMLQDLNKEVERGAELTQEEIANQQELEAVTAQVQQRLDRISETNAERRDEAQAEAALLEFQGRSMEQAAKKAERAKKATQMFGAALTTLGPTVAGLNAMLEGSITRGEATQQAITSVGTALMGTMNPYAMAGGAVLSLIGVYGDFRSESEKVKDANEDMIRSFVSMKEQVYNARLEVAGMKDEYKAFEGVDIPNLLEKGSQEDIDRYVALSEKVANVAPELVKYYDAEGRAIIDLTVSHKELQEARQEEVRAANEFLAVGREGFLLQATDELKQANKDVSLGIDGLNKAKEALKKAEETGNNKDATNALADIQKYHSMISDGKAQLKETGAFVNANVVRPFLEGHRELDEMIFSSSESMQKLGKDIRSLSADSLDSGFLGDLLGSGMDEQADMMIRSIDDIIKKAHELSEAGEGNEFLEMLKGMGDEELRNAIMATGGEIEQITAIVNQETSIAEASYTRITDAQSKLASSQEKVQKLMEKDGDYYEGMAQNATVATGAMLGVGLALAPVSGGLSLVATGAIGATGGLIGAATAASISEGSMQDYKKALREVTKAEKELAIAREGTIATARQAAKTEEGLAITSKRVGQIKDATKALEKYGKALDSAGNPSEIKKATGALQEQLKAFPKLAAKYGDITDASEATKNAIMADIQALQMEHSDYMYGLTLDSEEYFAQWKEKEAEKVDFAAEQYGIDASNYRTMAEYKTALEAMSVLEFDNYQKQKAAFSAEANDMIAGDALSTSWNIATAWAGSIGNTIDNMSYFQSDALSVSDKVKIAFLMAGDAIANSWNAVWNQVRLALNTALNAMSGAIAGFVDFFKRILSGVIDKYNQVAALIPGMKEAEGALVDFANSKTEKKTFDLDLREYRDSAGDYARDKINQREANKRDAIRDMTEYNVDAFAGAGGFSGLQGGGGGRGSVPTRPGSMPSAPSSGSGGSGGSGGGKGGKGGKDKKGKDKKGKKEKEEKDVENLELELDKYYKHENALKTISTRLTEVGRNKDEAFGEKRIKFMEDEQKQLAAQEQTLSKYVQALQSERDEKRRLLQGKGFTFDSQGEISNLNERLTALQNAANKKTGEAKKEAIENVKKIQEEAARYTEIHFNLIPDKQQALKEARATIRKIEREKVEYKVKLKVDKTELAQSVRDTMKELNEDDYGKLDENYVITSTQLRDHMEMVKFYEDKIKEVQANTGLSDADREELIRGYKNDMLGAISAAKGAYNDMSAIQEEFVNQSVEMIDTVNDNFDRLYDKADKVAEAFRTVYGDSAYAEIDRFRVAQLKTIDAQVRSLATAKSEMEYYRDSIKKGTNEWKAANEAVIQLGEQIDDSLIKKVELLQQRFAEFLEGLMGETDRSIFGSLGLDEYENQLERLLEKNDKMLNTYEKITKVGGLMAEVNEAIANATDPADAAAYKKFREQELETLMKADKVSADELERAELLWEIRQKEQALEDRKNASRMAQLIRDENGNMSYEYVQQKGDSETGQMKELADAKNSLYEFDNEKLKDANRQILAIIAETNEKIKSIYENTNLTEAEKKAALESAYADAKKDIADAQEDIIKWSGYAMKDGIEDLKHAFQGGTMSFEGLSVDTESMKKVFDAMDSGQLNIGQMLSGDLDGFAQSMGMTVQEATAAVNAIFDLAGSESSRYSSEIIDKSNQWLTATESNLETLANNYGQTQSHVNETTNILANSTNNLSQQIEQNSQAANENAQKIREQTIDMIASGKATDVTTNSFQKLTEALVGTSGGGGTLGAMVNIRDDMNKKLQVSLAVTKDRTDALTKSADGTSKQLNVMGQQADYSFRMTKQFDSQTIRTSNDNIALMATRAQAAAGNIKVMGENADVSRQRIATLSVALAALPGLDSGKRHYYTVTKKDGSSENVSYAKKPSTPPANSNYVGYFDTGGYTGEWTGSSGNQEGKFLMAHEKELILNKEDTENFLEGIQIQRDLIRAIGGGMDNVIHSIASGGDVINNNSKATSQNITVQANFPNATNSAEIESALRGLSLNAASYAHRS